MSAGHTSSARPDSDLGNLAPTFRRAVRSALRDCALAGLDAYVFEAHRSQELQELYYARGRTIKPPERPVTNAHINLYSWHGYGLAVDVISQEHYWDRPELWFRHVAKHFIANGCKWGGGWKRPDMPHMQWGRCKPSPSNRARELIECGVEMVWAEVGAL